MEETCDVSFFIPGMRKTGLHNRRKCVIMKKIPERKTVPNEKK